MVSPSQKLDRKVKASPFQRIATVNWACAWISITPGSTAGVDVGRISHGASHRHRPLRRSVRLTGVENTEHALDRLTGAGRKGFGTRPGIDDGEPKRFALGPVAVLQIEPDARNGRGASLNRGLEYLAGGVHIVQPHLDGISGDVLARHTPAVDVVDLLLDGVTQCPQIGLRDSRCDRAAAAQRSSLRRSGVAPRLASWPVLQQPPSPRPDPADAGRWLRRW